MEYVQFGSTEFKVSRLALGAERMGYPARFRRGHCTRSRANRLLALTTKGVDAALLAPRVPLDGARYTLELITQRSPAGKSAPVVENFGANSIVDELEREGFLKKLAARR